MRIDCHNDESKGEERRCDDCARLGYCGYDPNQGRITWIPGEKRFTLEPLVKMGETAGNWLSAYRTPLLMMIFALLVAFLFVMVAASTRGETYITLSTREWQCTIDHMETRLVSSFDPETEQLKTHTEVVTVCDQYNRRAS